MSNRDVLLTRAIRLHSELRKIRHLARKLPVDDMNRWRLSLRAGQIGRALTAIENERRTP